MHEELLDQHVGEGAALDMRNRFIDQGFAPGLDVYQPYLAQNPDDERIAYSVDIWDADGLYVVGYHMFFQDPTWLVGHMFEVTPTRRGLGYLTRVLYHTYDWTKKYGIDRLSIVAGGDVYWGPRGFDSKDDSVVSALPEQWVSHSDGTWDAARAAAQEKLGPEYGA